MTAEIVTIAPHDMIQGSPEWHAMRCGKVTASRVADIIAKTKTGYSALRANYLAELLVERLTGIPSESYTNTAMQWGREKETEAIAAYSFRTDNEIEPVGFVLHPRIVLAGYSPDAFIGDEGTLEVKCPLTATHLDTLLGQRVPARYITQMQFGLACSGRQWCDFVSYDPRLPESMRLFIRRLERDDKEIARLESAVEEFLAELIGKIADLDQIYNGGPSRLLTELRGSLP